MNKFSLSFVVAIAVLSVNCSSDLSITSANKDEIGAEVQTSISRAAGSIADTTSLASGLGTQSFVSSSLAGYVRDQFRQSGVQNKLRELHSEEEIRDLDSALNSGTCSPTTSGSPTDGSDGDGVPDSYTATYSCSSDTSGSLTFSISGTIELDDADDTDATSNYTVTISNFTYSLSLTTSNGTSTISGTLTLSASASYSSTTLSLSYNYSGSTTVNLASGTSYESAVSYSFTISATPDDLSDPDASGSLSLSGSLTATFDGDTGTFTIGTSGLTYTNSDCAGNTLYDGGINDGTVTISDGTSTITITYSSTCAATVASRELTSEQMLALRPDLWLRRLS